MPSIQGTAPGEVEGDVVGPLGHAAQIDDAREGPRRELVGHQSDVAAP